MIRNQWSDATAMAYAIQNKEVSAKELVLHAIENIETLNPKLNAVTSTRFDKALQEVEDRDFGDSPFSGVPILLKDLGQEQAGEPATSGSRLFKDYRARQSDNLVKALENLGFIIVGRSNTPEFGFKNISDSSLHGSVHLPDDHSRNAGGSSGGAAAAVSSGMVPLAAASDGGGSIRIPASFNGLIGLKPSRGRIPVGPASYRGWQGASVHFALTKSVRDTRNLLYHLQTCQMESPFVLPKLSEASLYAKSSQRLNIAIYKASPLGTPLSLDVLASLEKVAHHLEALGHRVTVITEFPLNQIESIKGYYVMNSVETANMFTSIERHVKRPMTMKDMEVMTWAIYRSGKKILASDYSAVLSSWDRYSATMSDFHATYDVLLTPTTTGPAPKEGEFTLSDELQEKLSRMDNFSCQEQQELIWQMFEPSLIRTPYTILANLTGQPAISLPVHRDADGLAYGAHFIAAKGREDLLLQIAQELETANCFE